MFLILEKQYRTLYTKLYTNSAIFQIEMYNFI